MEIRRLLYFLQIAEEGSMGRAANVLGIAQPALSRQVRLLEDALGAPLFVRSKRGMQLTTDGEQLRAAIKKPMREIELALQNVGAPSAPIEGTVVLGMASSTANILALPLLEVLRKEFPRVRFSVIGAPSGRLIDGLLRGAVDIALTPGPLPDNRLFEREILTEEFVLVGSASAGLSPEQPLAFSELAGRPLVTEAHRHGVTGLLEKTSLRTNVPLNIAVEMESLALMKAYVETGAAFSVMPYSAFRAEHLQGRLSYSPLRSPVLTQTVCFAVRQHLVLPRTFVWELGALLGREVSRLVAEGVWPAVLLQDAQ